MMHYNLKKEPGRPKYLLLYEALRDDILSGTYPAGSKLPSKRSLAADLNLGLVTVERSLEILCDEGYAEARERSGYVVCYGTAMMPGRKEPPAAPSRQPAAPEDFPFSAYAKTIRRVLSDNGAMIFRQCPPRGCPELLEAIAAYLKRSRGLSVRPEQLVLGAGAEYIYGMVPQLLGRERPYALEDPSYSKIRRVYEANGVSCELLKLGQEGILPEELARSRAGVLHVTPYNSFPSGITAGAPQRRDYARWAEARDAFIVEDDYDSEFSSALKTVSTVYSLAPERVLYVNSFSRTIAPSVRTGYMVLPEPLVPLHEERLGFYSCPVPVLEQLALAEFLNSGEFERHINRRRRRLRSGEQAEKTLQDRPSIVE